MLRHKLSPIIYLIIGLAILGLFFELFTNTASFITNIAVMIAVGAVIYGTIYYFFIRPRTSNDIKKYKKAVKQSKNKYNQDQTARKKFVQASKKQAPLIQKKRNVKTRATHLRVIDGNKQKRKNRASF